MRQNLSWPVAVGSSMFPTSGTAFGSCRGSMLWVRCRPGARWCKPHAMLGGLWGDLRGSLCHSAAPWAMLQVLEEKPSGLLIASLQAKDPDEGENGTIIYSLIGTSSRTGTPVLLYLAAGCPLPGIPTHTPPLSHPPLPSLRHAAPSHVSLSLQEPGQSVSLCTWPPGSCGQPRFCAAPTVPSTSSPQWPVTGAPRLAARQPSSVSRYPPPPGPARQLLLSLGHLPLACLLEDTIQLLGGLSPHLLILYHLHPSAPSAPAQLLIQP